MQITGNQASNDCGIRLLMPSHNDEVTEEKQSGTSEGLNCREVSTPGGAAVAAQARPVERALFTKTSTLDPFMH